LKYHYEAIFVYQSKVNKKEIPNYLLFSYAYILIQVIKYPTKAFYEVLKMNDKKNMKTLRENMIINYLIVVAKQAFEMMI
jgi:hypothetical protein